MTQVESRDITAQNLYRASWKVGEGEGSVEQTRLKDTSLVEESDLALAVLAITVPKASAGFDSDIKVLMRSNRRLSGGIEIQLV